MEQHMMQKLGLSQETIRKCLIPGPGDGFGIGPDVLSAYAFGFGGECRMNDAEEAAATARRISPGATAVSRGTW